MAKKTPSQKKEANDLKSKLREDRNKLTNLAVEWRTGHKLSRPPMQSTAEYKKWQSQVDEIVSDFLDAYRDGVLESEWERKIPQSVKDEIDEDQSIVNSTSLQPKAETDSGLPIHQEPSVSRMTHVTKAAKNITKHILGKSGVGSVVNELWELRDEYNEQERRKAAGEEPVVNAAKAVTRNKGMPAKDPHLIMLKSIDNRLARISGSPISSTQAALASTSVSPANFGGSPISSGTTTSSGSNLLSGIGASLRSATNRITSPIMSLFGKTSTNEKDENTLEESLKRSDDSIPRKLDAIEKNTALLVEQNKVGRETTDGTSNPVEGLISTIGDALVKGVSGLLGKITGPMLLGALGIGGAAAVGGFLGKKVQDWQNEREANNVELDKKDVASDLDFDKVDQLSDHGELNKLKDTFTGKAGEKGRMQYIVEQKIEKGQSFTPKEAAKIKQKFGIEVPKAQISEKNIANIDGPMTDKDVENLASIEAKTKNSSVVGAIAHQEQVRESIQAAVEKQQLDAPSKTAGAINNTNIVNNNESTTAVSIRQYARNTESTWRSYNNERYKG